MAIIYIGERDFRGSETVLWHCSPISQLTITILGKGEIFVIWDYFRALEFHVPIEKTLEKGISEDWGLFYATEIACPIWQYFGESDISVFETILCHWNCMDLRVGCWNPMCKMTVRWREWYQCIWDYFMPLKLHGFESRLLESHVQNDCALELRVLIWNDTAFLPSFPMGCW